ncbi:DUF58 domain-containing protein [Virgibacillus sp. C22-A2]|uniref:DUF58 domain-containing protein n=2 Tax=Virgibacillus tibetensis TaxID=3042313 RepID=A0ABU6KK01_9BACI|nr:DUF58 domain-containing protein [Virgibacillus sp. C22-A2]
MKNWKVTRKLSHHVIRAGDGITVTLQVRRSVPFPLYYCICEEIFPTTLKKIDNRNDKYQYMDRPNKLKVDRSIKEIVFPSFRRVFEITYKIEQVPRGEHTLQKVRIRTGDVFGFVKKEHVFNISDKLVAYPKARAIHMTEQLSNFEQGSAASYTFNLKNTNVASGVREYAPGDKFSWIDWKQTARKNEVMTKEFEQEKSTDILLILDSCYYEGINYLAFEASVEVTISLIREIRRQSTNVGLLSIGETSIHFPEQNDYQQQDWIRQHLTRIQPNGSQVFSNKLKEEVMKLESSNIVMIITTRITNSFKETIQKMKQRTKRVVVIYVQSSKLISQTDYLTMQKLQFEGVSVHLLTEKQLMKNPIEVNMI